MIFFYSRGAYQMAGGEFILSTKLLTHWAASFEYEVKREDDTWELDGITTYNYALLIEGHFLGHLSRKHEARRRDLWNGGVREFKMPTKAKVYGEELVLMSPFRLRSIRYDEISD